MTAFVAFSVEHRIAIAGIGLGAAILVPEMHAALAQAGHGYGGTAVAGTLLGTLGAAAMAVGFESDSKALHWTWMLAAGAIAAAFSLASGTCAGQVAGPVARAAAYALAALPLLCWGLIAVGLARAQAAEGDGPARWAALRAGAKRVIDRIDNMAARADDTPDERLTKAILVFLGVFGMLAGGLGAWHFAQRGATDAAAWLLGYGVLTAIGFAHFVGAQSRRLFEPLQLVLLLLVPFALQDALGGFAAAGAVGLWAMLAPLAALVFQGPQRSVWWFAAFVLLALVAAVREPSGGSGPALWFVENLLLAASLVFILLRHFVSERAKMRLALEREQARSESLLLNILPGPIAERLKRDPHAIADDFAHVSVLFADIVGFTQLSARVTPAELVGLLNDMFSRFDRLAAKHGVEKIKTIGDAYMACAGLPVERDDHAVVAVELALEMQQALVEFNRDHGAALQVRIGINSGPVVAGVIGLKKFIYDLWGDTVNTASRMESHGVPGAVQVSAATRALLGERYRLEPRGEIEVKGKGRISTFLVLGRAG